MSNQRIQNNNAMFITQIRDAGFINLSSDSKKYLHLTEVMPGVHDIRARIGTFNNPWRGLVPEWYAIPSFNFINDKLSDILDARAIELLNVAKQENKSLVINWSGGTDSTTVLTSFLKNTTPSDQHLLTVCCNTTSIQEYLKFYLNHISPNNNIKIKTSNTLLITKEYLDNNIILHGDPADCLFGPSQYAYEYFSNNNQHLEPWSNHSNKMIELMDYMSFKNGVNIPDLGKWWFDIVTRTLEESGQSDYVSSVADWWWWTYYNFKWSFSCQRPLFFGLPNVDHEGLPVEYQQSFAKNTFYNTEKFQQWSFSNLKKLVGPNVAKSFKAEAKKYIYDFTKDESVYLKRKKASIYPTTIKKIRTTIIGYDNTYIPVYNNWKTKPIVQTILERWKES
jgi:hypothetical protein